jgi:transposase
MTSGSGVSRGDRNRNARLARLRELVPVSNAIVGIDLADRKQMVVVCDHDSKVLARKTFRCRAWDLGVALDWASERAVAKGFSGATVACEPTGHRWRVLGQLATDRSMRFVCVQPIQTSWARRSEDLTFDKTDDKDAVLIARLTAQLRCYVPEPVDETWGRLRHLGARRERLIVEAGAQVRQVRDLLECVWPAALEAANWPFRSKTWAATLWVILDRDGGDFTRTRPGSRPQSAARSPSGAGRDRASGSPASCSPHSPIRPGCSRIVAAPWSGCSYCWRTGPTPNASSPTPRAG